MKQIAKRMILALLLMLPLSLLTSCFGEFETRGEPGGRDFDNTINIRQIKLW